MCKQVKGNAWGHIVLTNVGSIGLEQGFAPLPTPICAFICACIGKVEKKPVVENDQIVIKPLMTTVFTVDHRFGDAALALKFLKIVKDYVEDPENFDIEKYP